MVSKMGTWQIFTFGAGGIIVAVFASSQIAALKHFVAQRLKDCGAVENAIGDLMKVCTGVAYPAEVEALRQAMERLGRKLNEF
jgi:hypothetical protein